MADRDAAGEIRAAGVVLWRPGGSPVAGLEVALIHRPKYDDWSFPKGKLEPGEHVLQAAVRETAEETGLTVTLGHRLPHLRYAYGDTSKRVDYWAATAADASLPFRANSEVDRLDWLPVAKAQTRLTYAHDVELLAKFGAAPARTVPLILLRHASAGSKSDWQADDLSRPLDAEGVREAEDLAALLSCFGVMRAVSSPAERCLATVRPYARAAGVPVEEDAVLAVAGGKRPARTEKEVAALAAQLAASGRPVVACAHRENMPALLAGAYAQLGGALPADRPLHKAEFAVLHAADGKLVAAERYQVRDGLAMARMFTEAARLAASRA